MKNVKKLIALSLVMVMSMALFGCMRDESTIVVDEQNNLTITESMYIDKQEYRDMIVSLSDDKTEAEIDQEIEKAFKDAKSTIIDGKEYVYDDTMINVKVEKDQYAGMTINKDIFYMPITNAYKIMDDSNNLLNTGGDADLDEAMKKIDDLTASLYNIMVVRTITLPNEIVYTNGELSLDKKSATFKGTINEIIASGGWYAMTAAGYEIYNNDTVAPSVQGVASGDYLPNLNTVFAEDNVAVLSYDINGVEYQIGQSGDTYIYTPVKAPGAESKEGLKEGENTLTVTDVKGNKTAITFNYDITSPVISGAKNGKTYKKSRTVKVYDAQGVKKIAVNGKVKNLDNLKKSGNKYSIKATKKGKNTIKVMDNAGNVTKITFKIKK
jgi:uncharacterized lipoprotein NlpE involved in copper resistance